MGITHPHDKDISKNGIHKTDPLDRASVTSAFTGWVKKLIRLDIPDVLDPRVDAQELLPGAPAEKTGPHFASNKTKLSVEELPKH